MCTVDTILDSEQYLSDNRYKLIRDISREIDSGSMAFGATLRNRCKAASLILEWETWGLLDIMMYQLSKVTANIVFIHCAYASYETSTPQRVRNAYRRPYSGILCVSVLILSFVALLFFTISPEVALCEFTLAYYRKGDDTRVKVPTQT